MQCLTINSNRNNLKSSKRISCVAKWTHAEMNSRIGYWWTSLLRRPGTFKIQNELFALTITQGVIVDEHAWDINKIHYRHKRYTDNKIRYVKMITRSDMSKWWQDQICQNDNKIRSVNFRCTTWSRRRSWTPTIPLPSTFWIWLVRNFLYNQLCNLVYLIENCGNLLEFRVIFTAICFLNALRHPGSGWWEWSI